MSLIKRSLLIMALCGLSACGGGDTSTTSPPGNTTVEPPIKTTVIYGALSSAEIALIGKDADTNGIRDDVDAWILATFKDSATQTIAKTRAQWLTWAMLRGARNVPVTTSETNKIAAANACWIEKAYSTMGDGLPGANDWEALLFNTHLRAVAYLTWDANSDGIVREIHANPCNDVIGVPTL